jgi:hypothetical protein
MNNEMKEKEDDKKLKELKILESPLVVIFGGQTSEQEQCRQGLHHQL